ncbi:MAG: hypothetical protein HKN48_05360 [Flavobacteriaceae bacterium]|nr:hypothetical protein [Flavobacteriaceae bacterium]
MRVNWNILKLLFALVILGGIFGFAQKRNSVRKLSKIQIEFVDENNPMITLATVNKLLIQNNDSVTSISKETLVLEEMESRLLQNDMVRDAQVFVTVDGKLGAKIEQKNPIARVVSSPNYYVDEDGEKMPLSKVYAARVPLVTGNSKKNFTELTPLLLKIREDEFMKHTVIGVHKNNDGTIELELRKMDYKIHFGKLDHIERKFQNYKAFYHKIKKENMLAAYNMVDLQFGNQVVATKK